MPRHESDSEVEIVSGPSPSSLNARRAFKLLSPPTTESSLDRSFKVQALSETHISLVEDKRVFCGLCDVWVSVCSEAEWYVQWRRHCCSLRHQQNLDRIAYENNMANMENEHLRLANSQASMTSTLNPNFPGVSDLLNGKN